MATITAKVTGPSCLGAAGSGASSGILVVPSLCLPRSLSSQLCLPLCWLRSQKGSSHEMERWHQQLYDLLSLLSDSSTKVSLFLNSFSKSQLSLPLACLESCAHRWTNHVARKTEYGTTWSKHEGMVVPEMLPSGDTGRKKQKTR